MKKDRISNVAIENGITASVIGADLNGFVIDLKDYMDGCKFVAAVNGATDTYSAALYVELEIEESSDGTTFTDAADADVNGSVTGTNTGTFAVINAPAEAVGDVYQGQYTGIKRYCRCVANFTGANTGIGIAVIAEKLGYKYPPVS